MCEKPRLWVSHTDHRVPPAPLWDRQPCSDQPTADPALIGFFSLHCALQGRKSFCGVKGEAFLPFPSLELIGRVTRWPNPPGLTRGRPARARPSEPAPSGQERVWRPGSRGGRGPPGAGLHLPRIYYSPAHPRPRPCRDVYSWTTSAGWRTHLSLSFSLVRCLQSPRSRESGHIPQHRPLLSRVRLLQGACNPNSPPPPCPASRPLPVPSFPPGHAGLSLLALVPSA